MPGLCWGNLPACGPIPLLWLLPNDRLRPSRMHKKISFLRVFTETGPLVALAVAIALLVGIVGPASAQFFNFPNFGGPPRPPPRSGGYGGGGGGWVGGGLFFPLPPQGPERVEKFF